jgi:hypothetical protein
MSNSLLQLEVVQRVDSSIIRAHTQVDYKMLMWFKHIKVCISLQLSELISFQS